MVAVGWNPNDLFLVFVIKGRACSYMEESRSHRVSRVQMMGENWKNVAIVSDEDGRLKKMLGTTAYHFAISLQETSETPGLQVSWEQVQLNAETETK